MSTGRSGGGGMNGRGCSLGTGRTSVLFFVFCVK